jgi:hypothetical protein
MDHPDENESSRGVTLRESLAWHRRGPVRYRVVKLLWSLLCLVLAYLSPMLVTTLMSFTRAPGRSGRTDHPSGRCRRRSRAVAGWGR